MLSPGLGFLYIVGAILVVGGFYYLIRFLFLIDLAIKALKKYLAS